MKGQSPHWSPTGHQHLGMKRDGEPVMETTDRGGQQRAGTQRYKPEVTRKRKKPGLRLWLLWTGRAGEGRWSDELEAIGMAGGAISVPGGGGSRWQWVEE